jgi:hypothetical protein
MVGTELQGDRCPLIDHRPGLMDRLLGGLRLPKGSTDAGTTAAYEPSLSASARWQLRSGCAPAPPQTQARNVAARSLAERSRRRKDGTRLLSIRIAVSSGVHGRTSPEGTSAAQLHADGEWAKQQRFGGAEVRDNVMAG